MKIKKRKLKRWKVGEVRIRRARGVAEGYGFYCMCGNYTTIGGKDKIKIEKAVNGYIHRGKCSKCKSWVVLESL